MWKCRKISRPHYARLTVILNTLLLLLLLLSSSSSLKGTAIPLQAWTGPESSRRLRLPDFKRVGT